MNLEGIVAKYKFSKYLQGTRSREWLKIKSIETQDCVVIGYTKGEGNRENYFGSLLLAVYYYNNDSHTVQKLRFVGHTGSGFSFDQLGKIYNKLKEMRIERCPIDYIPYTNQDPIWIEPILVAEVKFNDWTQEKIMRAPIFLRFREDKMASECIVEEEKSTEDIIPKEKNNHSNLLLQNLPKCIHLIPLMLFLSLLLFFLTLIRYSGIKVKIIHD
jgi:bifunctional non-homologous end joining protein LigD